MSRGFVSAAMLFPLLSGCALQRPVVTPAPKAVVETPVPVTGWRAIASAADQARVDTLSSQLRQARAEVPRRLGASLAAQGPVVDPDGAQPAAQLPPGSYYCRLIRFGGTTRFRIYPPDFCYVSVEADGLAFTKQTGSTLPEGYLYPDIDKRLVFLGTYRTAGEGKHGSYGKDPAHDMAGVVERVAPFRWRLIVGRTGADAGAALDLYELVPVPTNVPGAKPATQPQQ